DPSRGNIRSWIRSKLHDGRNQGNRCESAEGQAFPKSREGKGDAALLLIDVRIEAPRNQFMKIELWLDNGFLHDFEPAHEPLERPVFGLDLRVRPESALKSFAQPLFERS